jgi:hypothetical protein
MKKLLLLSAALLMINAEKASAKIWTVNNNVALAADFRTAQGAIDSASHGDTIYFEPSKQKYGDITINNKKLAVFTNSSENKNFGILDTATTTYATLGSITVSSSDSVFLSVRAHGVINLQSSDYVTVTNSYFIPSNIAAIFIPYPPGAYNSGVVQISYSNHAKITKSVMDEILVYADSYNIEVSNNILADAIRSVYQNNGSMLVKNNTFHTNPVSFGNTDTLKNAVVVDNIYFHRTNTYFVNSIIQGNWEFGEATLSGVNNLMGASTTTPGSYVNGNQGDPIGTIRGNEIFGKTSSSNNSTDNGWGAIVKGPPGGTDPYQIGAPPPIPAVTSLQVAPVAANGTLNVQFSALSNK